MGFEELRYQQSILILRDSRVLSIFSSIYNVENYHGPAKVGNDSFRDGETD